MYSVAMQRSDDYLHVSSDDLELYVLGRCDSPSCSAIEQHLIICRQCQVRSIETARFVAGIRNAMRLLLSTNSIRDTPDAYSRCGGGALVDIHIGGALFSWNRSV